MRSSLTKSALRILAFCVGVAAFIVPARCAEQTLTGIKLPDGFQAEIFATADQISNPVAICFDPQGRLYTAEAQRKLTGVWGVTMSRWWAMEDYANKSLTDRQAMYDRWAHIVPPAKMTRHSDVVRQLVDTDGDGRADVSRVFADGFNDALDGNAAGIIERDGEIYLADVPNLWRLKDSNSDGTADLRESIFRGLGVRVGVHGHDLHGLAWGPDGRLYFTIGDRGFHLKNKEGALLSAPTRGAAFRCFADGNGLEIFHIGLRNPQEIAFNNVGDLFTVDNNMGGGDKCRVVQIIEGGDSGWDATYQLTQNFREETGRFDHTAPPWFSERLWDVPHEGRPAWVGPPIAHLTTGPSGLAHHPGVGLSASDTDSFLVCDFTGTSAGSSVRQFNLNPAGAGYKLESPRIFVSNILPTDIAFGYDGGIYVTDWISGWGGEGDRRIVRIFRPDAVNTAEVLEIKKLFADGFSNRPNDELVKLLGHADQRVRQHSQFELAKRTPKSIGLFLRIARYGTNPLARLHGIWGLWQVGLKQPLSQTVRDQISNLLDDGDAEVRAQTAKVAGELHFTETTPRLIALLNEPDPRPRYFATISLGKLRHANAVPAIANMLRENRDLDLNLRHAGVFAFSRLAPAAVTSLADDASRSVRMAVLLSLRQTASPSIRTFLDDPDPGLRFEAVRAIHDLPIADDWNDLAVLISSPIMRDATVPFPIKHRILNANFRLGTAKHAGRIAQFAADPNNGDDVRLEALRSLEKWSAPSPFDRVTWHHRPLTGDRDFDMTSVIGDAITASFRADLDLPESADRSAANARMQIAGRMLAGHDLLDETTARSWLKSPQIDPSIRLAMIGQYRNDDHDSFISADVAETLLNDNTPEARIEGAVQMLAFDVGRATEILRTYLAGDAIKPRQLAIHRLGESENPVASGLLAKLFNDRATAPVGADTLDLFLAGIDHSSEALRKAAGALDAAAKSSGPLGEFQMALNGGDAERGRRIFETHAIQCVRCHKIRGFGGDAGPDLTSVNRDLDRAGIITALIDPPARIAPGFGTFEFHLKDGETIGGIVTGEDDTEVRLTNLAGETILLNKSEIQSRSNSSSAMPTMKGVLTLSEVRDLVEYLAGSE